MALLGRVFVSFYGLVLAAILVGGKPELEEGERTRFLGYARTGIKSVGRHGEGPTDRQRHAEYRNL